MLGIKAICDSLPAAAINEFFTFATGLIVEKFGKVGEAAKKINNDDSIKGVHELNDQIKSILQQKHPKAREVEAEIILPQTNIIPEPVIYEEGDYS